MIPFLNKRYEIIYADPPWKYDNNMNNKSSSILNSKGKYTWTDGNESHYSTMKLEEMKEIKITSITTENALLFMWASSPHLYDAMQLGVCWGFKWATIGFIWNKESINPGSYTMSSCELCLIFKCGNIPQPRGETNIKQFLSVKRGPHSVKPNEVRKRIERMFPTQSKIELFAREIYPGWDAWGNEINLVDNPDQSDIKPVEQIKLF